MLLSLATYLGLLLVQPAVVQFVPGAKSDADNLLGSVFSLILSKLSALTSLAVVTKHRSAAPPHLT